LKLFRINSLGTALRALIAWPLLALGLYMVAALIGSLMPVNGKWQNSQNGYDIFLHDNGIHLSIIVPRKSDRTDLDAIFPAAHLPGGPQPSDYLMFGWGDRDFYLNTPTWGDLSPRHALNAFVGSGQTLLHVDHLDRLPTGVKQIGLEHEDYQTILSEIALTVKVDATQATPAPITGYRSSDVFYPARGADYSALYTCNNWVSDILAKARIRTGRWTPLPFGVMWWHPR
jgi:uncharacterized protein (TIGR02117 family)